MPEGEGSTAPVAPDSPDPRLRWVPLALFLVLPGLLVYSSVGSGQILYGSDALSGLYHLRGAISRAFSEGRLPVWEPHVMAGQPLLAGGHAAVFYPPTWLLLVLSISTFWTLTQVLHLSLAGLFAREWLKRGLGISEFGATAGGLLYLLSSFVVSHLYLGHINHVWAYAWIPALLWRLELFLTASTIRHGVWLALVFAMLYLAGIPPYVFYAGLLVAARFVHYVGVGPGPRKDRIRAVGWSVPWFVLGLLLCAPQVLSTAELSSQAQRTSINTYDFVTSYSVAPISLFTFLAPTFFGDAREAGWWCPRGIWESSGFVGLSGLALATLGALGRHPQRRLWAGVAVVGVLLALGRYSPVFKVFFHLVPGVSLFRAPARYLLLFTVAVTALAAMGVQRLVTGDETLRRHSSWVAGAALVVVLACGGLRLSLGPLDGPEPGWWSSLVGREKEAFKEVEGKAAPPASRPMAAKSLVWASACAAAVAVTLLVRRGMAGAAALTLLLVGELWVYTSRYYVGYPVAELEWPPEFVSAIRQHPQYPFRIVTVTPEQTSAIAMCELAGIDHLGGYDALMLRRYTEFMNVARGKPASDVVVAMVHARPGPLFDLMGARIWIVPGPKQEPPGWRAVGELASGIVYENLGALPRAFLVGRSVVIESSEERLRFLSQPGFDPRRLAVLESPLQAPLSGPEETGGTVHLASAEPGLYSLRVECPAEAVLVLSEAWYPGWSVVVDGLPGELLRADHLIQAVRVPAGRHDVQFRYRPRFLAAGFGIAAAAVGIFVGLLFFRRTRGPAM
jgi:hypothetical protein